MSQEKEPETGLVFTMEPCEGGEKWTLKCRKTTRCKWHQVFEVVLQNKDSVKTLQVGDRLVIVDGEDVKM